MAPSSLSSSATFLAAAAATLVSVTLISLYDRRRRKVTISDSSSMLSYPPTPPTRHWLFGHAHAVDLTKTTNHDILFLKWMQDLKSKVVMFELPIVGRFIVVGDAAVARYVLSGNFRKSPTYRALLPLIGKKSLVTMEGGEWSAQRRMYNPGFSPDFLRGIVSTIVEKCVVWLTSATRILTMERRRTCSRKRST